MRIAVTTVFFAAAAAALLGGCAAQTPQQSAMTSAEPAALPQPLPQQPQDVRTPLPPPQKSPVPPAQTQAQAPAQTSAQAQPRSPLSGVYLQLDTGASRAQNANMKDTQPASPDCLLQPAVGSVCNGTLNTLGSSPIIGGGIGYKLPLGFRVDVTYNYRSGYNLKGSDPGGTDFDPKVTAKTAMVNGYYNLPFTIAERVTPYVGGGLGRTKNKVNNINWNDLAPPGSSGQVPGGSQTSTAWQLTLGADVKVTQNWVLNIGYRYVNLGNLSTSGGAGTSGQPFNANNYTTPLNGKLRANELLFSIRYELD